MSKRAVFGEIFFGGLDGATFALASAVIAATYLLENNTQEANINFYSDSQTTLSKLLNKTTNSKHVETTKQKIQALQLKNNITLNKVKAHIGIVGNEMADQLAKEATKNSRLCPNTLLLTKEQIKQRAKQEADKLILEDIAIADYNNWTTTILNKLIRDYPKLSITDKTTLKIWLQE